MAIPLLKLDAPPVERKADAVFEGGGVKGIGLAGAIVEAEARGYRWVNVAGTSAGAALAALIAAGYRGEDLARILEETDFRAFQDLGSIGRIPILGPPLHLLRYQGIFKGDALEDWIRDLLEARGVHTFGDLVLPEFADDPRYRYRLRVVASDLTRGRMVVFPQDAVVYGISPDQLDVARAVRVSMSIPFYFQPVRFPLRFHSGDALLVDGGLLSNFPVWLFDQKGRPDWPTFGIRTVGPGEGRPREIKGLIQMLMAVVSTMLEAHDARHLELADDVRTISVPSMGVHTVDFGLSRRQARILFDAGRRAAAKFFATWDFSRYVESFRS